MTDQAPGPSDRAALLIEPGNQFGHAPPPFFSIPSWWRRFLFRVLTPRDLAAYCHIVSLMDRNAIAFPTQRQIAQDLGVSEDSVAGAARKLERYGFLLSAKRSLPGRSTATARTVYQRPIPEYTLLKLASAGRIDDRLTPRVRSNVNEQIVDDSDTSQSAVATGLRNLLGDHLYSQYAVGLQLGQVGVLAQVLEEALRRKGLDRSSNLRKL